MTSFTILMCSMIASSSQTPRTTVMWVALINACTRHTCVKTPKSSKIIENKGLLLGIYDEFGGDFVGFLELGHIWHTGAWMVISKFMMSKI